MAEASEYAATFDLVDTDGDGLISVDELHALMGNLGDDCTRERAAAVVRSMDTDGDGRISLEEFTAYMDRQ
ncbi:EF-hand domain-containing protein [Nocardiopsis sp. CNT312]|uniref:EF-hand domain-containing protein n=1 Tax=Nocardiopsis sp. CNT312 TaxID=1137268 RepID=UPI00049217EE|nr:EF-hand domain-containing protein [Nocardiopsis sp. CNT312]